MWDNIGRKLQTLAKIVCWLGIIGSIIVAIAFWTQNNRYQSTILTGILYLVFGCIGFWISSWALYGLGVVVEHVENSRFTAAASGNTSNSRSALHAATESSTNNYWICSNCKSRNPISKVGCSKCGSIRY